PPARRPASSSTGILRSTGSQPVQAIGWRLSPRSHTPGAAPCLASSSRASRGDQPRTKEFRRDRPLASAPEEKCVDHLIDDLSVIFAVAVLPERSDSVLELLVRDELQRREGSRRHPVPCRINVSPASSATRDTSARVGRRAK